jgi:hypothetical protein
LAAYDLLLAEDIKKVRAELSREQYFYHCTLDNLLDSIRSCGLDPEFEQGRSSYGERREPSKAMRFCTRKSVYELCFKTAETRAEVWCPRAETWVPSGAKLALLRTPATSLLNWAFGLDLSFGPVADGVATLLKAKGHLTAQEFITLVSDYGSISCYEAIPAGELEILSGEVRSFCTSHNNGPWIWTALISL